MDKQKIAELAKQLEALVEQDGSESTIVNLSVHKTRGGKGNKEVRISRFLSHDFWAVVDWVPLDKMDEEIMLEGVAFEFNYFQALGVEFDFAHEAHNDFIYHAIKHGDRYIVTWDDELGKHKKPYPATKVRKYVQEGNWIVKGGEQ